MMKAMCFGLVALVMTTCAAVAADGGAAAGEPAVLVKLLDELGAETYQVMSPAELKTMQAEIEKEAKVFPKAVAAAEKDWKTGDANKGKPFPKGSITPRKAIEAQRFSDRAKAEEKLAQIEEKDADRLDKAATRQKDRDKMLGRDKDQVAKNDARERERLANIMSASEMIKQKLAELTAAPAPAEAPAEGK